MSSKGAKVMTGISRGEKREKKRLRREREKRWTRKKGVVDLQSLGRGRNRRIERLGPIGIEGE